jgi:hypothetical protein
MHEGRKIITINPFERYRIIKGWPNLAKMPDWR